MTNYVLDAIHSHPFNALTLVFSGLAVIISVLAAVASRRQAASSERQASATEETVRLQAQALARQAEDVNRAISLAERSAAAAEMSAQAARVLVEIGERPWVHHANFTTEQAGLPDGKISVTVRSEITNGGKSPALELRIRQEMVLIGSLDDLQSEIRQATEPTGSVATLGPGNTARPHFSFMLRPTEYQSMLEGTKVLYVRGVAQYRSVLGGDYETTWCLVATQALQSGFAYARKYNEMT